MLQDAEKAPTDAEVHALLAAWLRDARAEDTKKLEKLQERERLLRTQTRKTRADLRHIAKKLEDCKSDLTYVVDDVEMYYADVAPV